MEDKALKTIEKEKFEHELHKKILIEKIKNLKQVIDFNKKQLEQIDREMKLKMKAPLSLEPKFAYENLPEWETHLSESIRLAMESEKLNIQVQQIDAKARLEHLNKELEELKKDE